MVLYVSYCWVGKTHDYAMFKQEFPPDQDWFKEFRVRVDLGFLGMDKDYTCQELFLPNKKKKKQDLSPEEKEENSGGQTRRKIRDARGTSNNRSKE